MAAGNRWPFGTRLRVEHVGVVTVTDRIGWGSDLDLYMTSCSEARQFGRRHLTVTVVR
jgi:3D (Asp-Asp-Asp) domain-containing protein